MEVELVAVAVALGVIVEADGDAVVVDAEELVNSPRARVGVDHCGRYPSFENEAEVVAGRVNVKADSGARVVDPDNLGLRRAGEVHVDEVPLVEGRVDDVPAVGVDRRRGSGPEVTGDLAEVVDAEKLIELGSWRSPIVVKL